MAKKVAKREGFEVYQSKGQWFWRLTRRGRVVADGAEGYHSRSNALRAAHGVRRWLAVGVVSVLTDV